MEVGSYRARQDFVKHYIVMFFKGYLKIYWFGIMAHAFNPNIRGADFVRLRPPWSTL